MCKYHFFTATMGYYENHNFSELLEEEQKYKDFIFWKIGTKERKHAVEKGDICYIYYSDLPDGSSRILFIGNVEDSDYPLKENKPSICPDAENGMLYMKIKLKSVSLKDKDKFSLKNLRKDYNLIAEKGQIGYHTVDKIKHSKLIKDIEEVTKNGQGSKLEKVTDHFNENYCICEFKDKDKSRNHKTFIEDNNHTAISTDAKRPLTNSNMHSC